VGHSLADHIQPPQPFASSERELRGVAAGDVVDALVEERLILEKIKTLESRMKYQLDKLLRVAEEGLQPKTGAQSEGAIKLLTLRRFKSLKYGNRST